MQIEDGWKKERESWEAERERLRSVVRDWEETSRRDVEENEDRALNERLSGEESSDDEKRDSQKPNGRSSRKPKRRRPSTKTSLAVRALRDITNDGSSTPTQTPIPLKASSELLGGGDVDVDDGVASALSDKSSESGKESVATLRDKDAGKRRARQAAEARQRNVSTDGYR
jgi:Ca2+-dependent lipid-binding protein